MTATGTEPAAGRTAAGKPLSGRVAVVNGSTRSIGKGNAIALGAAGATVYVTGRTASADTHLLGGSLEETYHQASA